MSDQDSAEEAAPAPDAAAGLATAMIVLTTVMLLLACFATLKTLGGRYNEGLLRTK
jgi:hypothetical protein